jgi:hypothetical protein
MKKLLLLELIVTSGLTAFLLWHWVQLIPRVLETFQPVVTAVWPRRREIEELHEGLEIR